LTPLSAPPLSQPAGSFVYISDEEEVVEAAKPVRFTATWKAYYGKDMKELVPGSSRAATSNTEALLYLHIEAWVEGLVRKLKPKQYSVVSLFAIASQANSRIDRVRADLTTRSELVFLFDVITD